MALENKDYVIDLICNVFKVGKDKFIVRPYFEVFPAVNGAVAADMDFFPNVKNRYIYGGFSVTQSGINTLCAFFNKNGYPGYTNAERVKNRAASDDQYNEWFTEDVLFNRLRAMTIAALASTSIVVKGWEILFNDR